MNVNAVESAFYVCRLLSDTESKRYSVYEAFRESSDLNSNQKLANKVKLNRVPLYKLFKNSSGS